jgi:hypothetical protein
VELNVFLEKVSCEMLKQTNGLYSVYDVDQYRSAAWAFYREEISPKITAVELIKQHFCNQE